MQKTAEKYFKNFILGSKLTPAGTARVNNVIDLYFGKLSISSFNASCQPSVIR